MNFSCYLAKMLTSRGFWSEENDCWKEINKNNEQFEDVVAEIITEAGKKYISKGEEKFDFEVKCSYMSCDSERETYAVAVAYAITVNNQAELITDCILYTTYIF